MFSQFRTAVEHLAQPPRRPTSEDASFSTSPQHDRDRSGSAEPQGVLPSHPTDPTIMSLRKSLAAQRSVSPKISASTPEPSKPRSKLEERLRASLSFTIGEASNSTTPDLSSRATPVPLPKSPASIPLPGSPIESPELEAEVLSRSPDIMTISLQDTRSLVQPTPVRADADRILIAETLEAAVDDQERRYTEADIPLPESPVERTTEEHIVDPAPVAESNNNGADVETLRQQLKLFKERFADVSSSFKRLQAEKFAVDSVLQELTPLQSINDSAGFREYIENISLQVEMSQDEIKRLNGKLVRQEERIEELRDTHRLESKSQSEQITRLRKQMEETEAILKVSQTSESIKRDDSKKATAEIERLKAEAEKLKSNAAQEEEKRAKAIALLKTVRQKLVKTEKERDDVVKELNDLKEKDRVERGKEKAERQKLQQELEQENLEREKAVAGLKVQFDKELSGLKARQEKEILALKGQYELEAVSRKNTYSKELEARNQQIVVLETSVQSLTRDKDAIFDELQMRQAELESSQAHMESLQSQTTEYQYQIRELKDRTALLTEELAEVQLDRKNPDNMPEVSTEVTRLLSNAGAKYEARLADLRKQLDSVERERNDADAEWSSKFSAKAREVEELKRSVNSSIRIKAGNEQAVVQLKNEVEQLKEDIRTYQKRSVDLQHQADKVQEVEDTVKMQLADSATRTSALEKQIEEAKARETQLRTNNKTIREELRKVQSSAALLEKQRNPGLGFWASRENLTESRTSISSSPDTPSRVGSPTTQNNSDEEVNLEYLRNVVLQFLEHKEMRPNLVRVLTTILRFTPQETRRLSRSL